ncbi:MAG TPA: aminoglycoside phosphotransferase family protein [Kineosporiaceae bacterium]
MTAATGTPSGLPLSDDVARGLATVAANGRAAVSLAETSAGSAVIKLHARPDRWRAELHAYLVWVPAVADRAPALLGASNEPPALVLSAVPGRRLDQARLTPDAERAAYAELGQLLRAFHASAPVRHGTDITSWLAERGRHWLTLATDLVSAQDRQRIANHLTELERLGDLPAAPCHLDLTPSNIIITPTDGIVVLDYEHARYDLTARDLVRLHDRVWPDRPDLAAAFLDTYGPLNDLDREIIQHTTPLDRLTRLVRSASRTPPHGTQPRPPTPSAPGSRPTET